MRAPGYGCSSAETARAERSPRRLALLLAAITSSAPQAIADGQDTRQRVEDALAAVARELDSPGWPADTVSQRALEQVKTILRQRTYRIAIAPDASHLAIAQERGGTLWINPPHFELLSSAEAEGVTFHELTHMLPEQTQRTAVTKTIERRLPASSADMRDAMLARTEAGRSLRRDYKNMLALEARNELESYQWQLAYMARQARRSGHAELMEYLDALARTTRLRPQGEIYAEWAKAMREHRLPERLVIGHVLNIAGPAEWPLLRELAADEGADVSSQTGIEAWLLSWAMDPEYCEVSSARSGLPWIDWVCAALAVAALAGAWWQSRLRLRAATRAES